MASANTVVGPLSVEIVGPPWLAVIRSNQSPPYAETNQYVYMTIAKSNACEPLEVFTTIVEMNIASGINGEAAMEGACLGVVVAIVMHE